MRGGALNKRVVLQVVTQGKDSSGGNVRAWVDVAPPLWAGIRHFSGEERRATKHGGEQAGARTEITLRYRSGIDATMRVRHGTVLFNIRHVNNVGEANSKLVLTCDADETGG